MTLLSVVRDVCAAVGVHQPVTVTGNLNADRTMFEMLAVANEMAQRIATDMRDWTMLRKAATITGTGVEAYNLPPDYRRMLTNGNVWLSTSTIQPMRFIPNTDQWLQRRGANYSSPVGEWTMYGGQIHIVPIMSANIPTAWKNNTSYRSGLTATDTVDSTYWMALVNHTSALTGTFAADRAAHADYWVSFVPVPTTARFFYLDKYSVLHAGNPVEAFTDDNDTYRLPERILKLGMIWSWKQLKGSPYAEDMGTWSDAMAFAMGTDSPAPILIDRSPISQHARIAYPWPVPTP